MLVTNTYSNDLIVILSMQNAGWYKQFWRCYCLLAIGIHDINLIKQIE